MEESENHTQLQADLYSLVAEDFETFKTDESMLVKQIKWTSKNKLIASTESGQIMVYSTEQGGVSLLKERIINECSPTYEIDCAEINGRECLFSTSKD